MKDPSERPVGVARAGDPVSRVSQLREEWRMARTAHADLVCMGMPRVNILLLGSDGVIQNLLETLGPDLRHPICVWSPRERFALPTDHVKSLVLRDVGTLKHADQMRLLQWLDRNTGGTQVVSTSNVPLMPRVRSGAFLETLYYRLNTIVLDVTV